MVTIKRTYQQKRFDNDSLRRKMAADVLPKLRRLLILMLRALRILRVVQFSLLASILLYACLGEIVGTRTEAANPTLNYLFSTLSVAIVGIIFVVRRTLVFRAEQTLAKQPNDDMTLSHWKTGYVATYALCEALALFGLILRIVGCSFQQCVPFYIGGFVLLFFFRAKQPAAVATS
jgi:hypothetical protein